jgi:hypothetical protein
MFDTLADSPPVIVALSLVSTALFGVALAAQPSPPPRADALAETVDTVAAADHPGVETRPLDADAVRITTDEIAVRVDDRSAQSDFAYGPVVPVRQDTALWAVLQGVPPDDAFEGTLAFASAAVEARQRDANWRRDRAQLTVRRVTWRGVDVTLVGA